MCVCWVCGGGAGEGGEEEREGETDGEKEARNSKGEQLLLSR